METPPPPVSQPEEHYFSGKHSVADVRRKDPAKVLFGKRDQIKLKTVLLPPCRPTHINAHKNKQIALKVDPKG